VGAGPGPQVTSLGARCHLAKEYGMRTRRPPRVWRYETDEEREDAVAGDQPTEEPEDE